MARLVSNHRGKNMVRAAFKAVSCSSRTLQLAAPYFSLAEGGMAALVYAALKGYQDRRIALRLLAALRKMFLCEDHQPSGAARVADHVYVRITPHLLLRHCFRQLIRKALGDQLLRHNHC